MKKPTKKEKEQRERQAEMTRWRFAVETAIDFDLRNLACRVFMLNKGATAELFARRAHQAFADGIREATRLLPKETT